MAMIESKHRATSDPEARKDVLKRIKDEKVDAFFVTLRKSERSFSPTTMYRDYAISRDLSHC